jgi:hypothetical protein
MLEITVFISGITVACAAMISTAATFLWEEHST